MRRLSVFAGGCTLEAAEAVAGSDLDTLQALVEKSLLRHLNERYWMLDTIRAFALEYLGMHDDAERAFRRHAEWFVALTESSAHELFGSEQADWLSRLEREHDNLRAALTWAYEAGQVELALRLTAAMQPFLYKHGHIMEGRRWLERARMAPDPQPAELRARILQGAGVFAATHDDLSWAQEVAEEGLALYRQLGDRHGIAILLRDLGIAAARTGDYEVALRCFEESAASFRRARRA